MTEIKTIMLDESDLKELVSDKYGVDAENVKIEVSNGDPQYPQTSVYVEVRL